MTIRNSSNLSASQNQSQARKKAAKLRMRHMLLEHLEQRQLLTVGPQLIGIQPNSNDLLFDGDVREVAPRELTFRFDDAQSIDPATLDGIRITAAGGDGSFGVATAQSDFGSNGRANILITADDPADSFTINVSEADLGNAVAPAVSRVDGTISITLNTNVTTPTTADALIQEINSALSGVVTAELNGGDTNAVLGVSPATGYTPISLDNTSDRVITPGAVLVGQSPDDNEVTLRFAETLKDDNYRIEIFGYDDPNFGVVGLRNTAGEFFQPRLSGTRSDTVDFRLDLGANVVSVVPQPVVRVGGELQQLRDTVVVYFDNDKLDVASVETPEFYQLIYTNDTVENLDDIVELPISVTYNAAHDTATLKFRTDINDLVGGTGDSAAFRLRIGSRESTRITPTRSVGAANVITDLNTSDRVRLRFTAREIGEGGNGIQLVFNNSLSGNPEVTSSGRQIFVDMGRADLTADELIDLIRTSSASSDLVSVSAEPGSDLTTVVGDTSLSFSPLTLFGLGSSFDTSSDLGILGSSTQLQTSLILSSAIDPQEFVLDLPGATDDTGQRQLLHDGLGFEEHINSSFGADSTDGITTIYYNFREEYSTGSTGEVLTNTINEEQKQRAREVLSLWAQDIGVQFVESADLGVTIATGQLDGLTVRPNTQIQSEAALGFGVRIDPTFDESLVIMSAEFDWETEYGANFSRTFAAATGMILGLEHAGDLPETTLLRLDPTFLSGSGSLIDLNNVQLNASDELYEPVFPGNQDILHAQHLHRPDGTDIDLYRFEVALDDEDQVGLLTAETFAQRLTNSSALNTNLELFRQVQATGSTNLGEGNLLQIDFEAVADGSLGNQLRISFTQSDRLDTSEPRILVFPNAIGIDLNTNPAFETTAQQVVDAINASSAASRLVTASLAVGDGSLPIGSNLLAQNPVVLTGGKVELVAQNDDYFSDDSYLKQSLTSGVYYIGVSASGNDDYNAALPNSGFGGRSQGEYDLRLTFQAQVDVDDTIRDLAAGDSALSLDGDGDGVPGGAHNFWFETRPLNRVISFNNGATLDLEGRVITVVGGNGIVRELEFTSDPFVGAGRFPINYANGQTAGELAEAVAQAIVRRPELGISAVANGSSIMLTGERSISIDPLLTLIDVHGKTIFVDKSAAPEADGSLGRPFNNIAGLGVPNAFETTHPGDIVRIVGNGGLDNDIATVNDNLAYEIGVGLLPGSILSDGVSMDVPKGVTAMIDAGAIFKLRQAAINVGSTNLNIDRAGANLQVLGAPILVDVNGNAIRNADGSEASGVVRFTSWLDETVGFDTYAPTTIPAAGDWGGISFQRDVDASAGRMDREDEGIFLRYVNHADVRYGGGRVFIDSIPRVVNSIQMLETRPTITDNVIMFGADAAMSALPDSFEETTFHEPRFQDAGDFTSDYDRVGPDIQRNTLVNNSVNGLFIRVDTPADGLTKTLTVPGRLDDTDVVHLVTENLIVSGNAGGAILDNTLPDASSISTAPTSGGNVLPADYVYKLTFVDRNGYESIPSASTQSNLPVDQDAIELAGLPSATGDFVSRKLYRSAPGGNGPFRLVADLDRSTSTFTDTLADFELGGVLQRDRLDVDQVISTPLAGGTLDGTYNYRLVLVDPSGQDGLASDTTIDVNVPAGGSVQLDQLPLTSANALGRRIYRSQPGGSGPYVLVGELPNATDSTSTSFTDDGSVIGGELGPDAFGVRRPRIDASLVIDPGNVIKLEAARIEATFGASILAEGTDGLPIVFTSKLDDTVGAGGSFDTNNNGSDNAPSPRDWGGIYVAPTASLSVDHARFAYGGGVTKLEGTFRAFNTIEVHQGEARIANSVFENNADGFGGQGPGTRFGRLSNAQSTIFVRGSQPTIIGNTFLNNAGSAIEIDVHSMIDDIQGDAGRQTGPADQNPAYAANRGPLIRGNRFANNGLNGLEIRAGDVLTSASVWDDTDIAHVVTDEIFVGNLQHEGSLRLQSSASESLVVKFDGYGSNFNDYIGAGLTAFGSPTTATDRVGGAIHVIGQPGFPVILTSLADDTVGAGLRPDGTPQNDTNNDGIGSVPRPGDWRGLFLDQYSNDRNVAKILESEDVNIAAPGPNGVPTSAQVLGDLAGDSASSNENRRLGFVLEGVLSQSEDVDVFSFSGVAGSEVWLDVDYTQNNLDLVLELLDANGSLLARSDNSTAEEADPSLIFVSNLIDPDSVNPLSHGHTRLTAAGAVVDEGTTNPLDPGMRIRLPGSTGSRSTFYFRVRSASLDPNNFEAGTSSGAYQVQVRLQAEQEWAGSTVNFADIRYATNGVHLKGFPGSSPLVGEAAEDESVRNGIFFADNGVAAGNGISAISGNREVGNRPQFLGNILDTDKGGFSVAGELASFDDVDFYRIDVSQEDLVAGIGNNFAPVVFDIDYADGFDRPDTTISVFKEEPSLGFGGQNQYRLLYSGSASNIADDLGAPLSGSDAADLSRGSAGTADGYIGPVALEEGTYIIGITSAAMQSRATLLSPFGVEPIESIQRVVDTGFVEGVTSATEPHVPDFAFNVDGNQLVSSEFSLARYSADDLPTLYMTAGAAFGLSIRDADGNVTPLPAIGPGSNRVSLGDFAGQSGLQLIAATNNTLSVGRTIIGFAERGEQIGVGVEAKLLEGTFIGQNQRVPTRGFSLVTYTVADQPAVNFDYQIFDGTLDVFVSAGGFPIRIATSDAQNVGPGETLLIAGGPQNVSIDLTPWAEQPNLQIIFASRDQNPTAITVSNVIIELGDGSRVFAGEPNPTFATVPVPNGTIVEGKYQLEVRLAENFFRSQSIGAPVLTQSFDTNHRFTEQTTLTAPAGSAITDGDQFSISDGLETVVFEFNSAGSFGLGTTPIAYSLTDTAGEIAEKIRAAINSSGVQSRIEIQAASAGGIATGDAGEDPTINLHGNASVENVVIGNPGGGLEIVLFDGGSDSNIVRDQGQILVQNSYIREPRDYGVWSEPAGRLQDPRDFETSLIGGFLPSNRSLIQDRPALAGTQAVRNLPVLNDDVDGGLLPGIVIENNVLEEGGLGGINLQGESPIWMISPSFLPGTDNDPTTNANGAHFGSFLDDGDYLVIDSDRTRLHFEFEDMAGAGTGGPAFGSGEVEGNGVRPDSVPVYYREEGGTAYTRPTPNPLVAFATNGLETMHALRDSILGSILVTNGTTQQVTATVAESLLGADPFAPPTAATQFYPEYYNRPAVYLEGVTNIQFINSIGNPNPFDIRPLDLGEMPQPHARIVNNTVIGKDGRASFNSEEATREDNDTIADAVQTWQGTSHNPLIYTGQGVIGDGGVPIAGGFQGGDSGGDGNDGGGSGNGGFSGNGNGGGFAADPDRLIVGYHSGWSDEARDAFLADQGLELLRDFTFIDAMLVGVADGEAPNRIDQLAGLPQVRYAEPDYIGELSVVPNDPRFGEQWHYDNQGQTGGTVDADIDLPEAWDNFTGSDEVVIAVIDSGVDYNHPDLAANMWVNPGEIAGDGIDNDNNGYVDDVHGIDPFDGDGDPLDENGHGTHVAGTTAAVTNNGTGVAGINWNSKIMALKIGSAGPAVSFAAAIESLNYLVMMKTQYGVNIVVSNNSYGGPGGSQAFEDAIRASIDVGIPFVAAAGNSGTDNDVLPNFPSGFDLDGIIAVSATDHNDQLAGFSQFGATTVDIAAPGVNVLSTALGGGYASQQGTSMASPHVAGVVALLAGAVPGATVTALKSAIMLGADQLPNLEGTSVSGARLNAANALSILTSDLGGPLLSTDVDIYQFKLGVGERAIIDIDAPGSSLDSILQIFDASGVPQEFQNAAGETRIISDNDAAPGESLGLDPYADFTALEPGVYYAAVSSVGNDAYDPLSLANRQIGESTGPYRISISARHLQDFVITAQDASAYNAGDTFTIFGVPDIGSTGSAGRTFEFVFGIGGPSNPANIPINLDPSWRFPDVAKAIAKAINEGNGGQRAISNFKLLPNGDLGEASPLPPVHAVALGGLGGVIDAPFNDIVGDQALFLDQFTDFDTNLVSGFGTNKLSDREIERLLNGPFDEINQGLELFTRRQDGFLITTTTTLNNNPPITRTISMGHLGLGHDRDSTNPLSPTSIGDGTTEKFVVVKNAAFINGNGNILVDPDSGENNNLDQLLPETGVLATRGASPTLINNTFFNLQTPVIAEESRRFPLTGGPAPYGSDNPDAVLKPGEVIIGGNIFQYDEPGLAEVRFGTGIEQGPTNVPNTALDLNFDIADGTQLFVNAQAGNYRPSAESPLIDSSIDSLPERASLLSVKQSVGLAASPVVAPDFDLNGQLRVDDPDVAPPSGQGQNIFKDRGAIERAAVDGPDAILNEPIDNDALGIDQDSSVSVVQLESGVYSEFRIQLTSGISINDFTVINSEIEGLRKEGAVLVLFENGRLLEEGIDYAFSYNATSDEIVLTPLAGLWKNDVVYEISINNRDRFAVLAPSGDQVTDGETFVITDAAGGDVVFEFDSGFRLQVPQGLSLQVPLAGGSFGGVVDGERISVITSNGTTTFEFDRNGNTLSGNIAVPFLITDSQGDITNSLITAIQSAGLPVEPVRLSDGEIFIGSEAGVRIDTENSVISQPSTTLSFKIPDLGPRPGGIVDGQQFTLSDGRRTITFEYDIDGTNTVGTFPIDISNAATVLDLTNMTQAAIASTELVISSSIVADDLIHLGLSASGTADVGTSNLELLGVSRTPSDGEFFSVTGSGGTGVFEFDNDGSVAAGNVAIDVALNDTQDTIADRIATAIRDANIGFTPISVGDGNIALGGEIGDQVDTANAPAISQFGEPGVRTNTQLSIFGPLIMQVPPGGSAVIQDNDTFQITEGGRTVTFEFDSDASGGSAPGNIVIPFSTLSTVNNIADAIVFAIGSSGLGIPTANLGGGRVRVGNLANEQVNLGSTPLTLSRGVLRDGEVFTVSNGEISVTFEFEDADVGNGFSLGNTPILFSASTSTNASVIDSIKAALEGSALGLTTQILPGDILELNATPRYTIDTTTAPSLQQSGVPGGTTAVPFIQATSFDGLQMKQSIVDAINRATGTNLVASDRGGDTFFVDNASAISSEVQSYFLRGVSDTAGKLLKPNRINDETAFTILMPGVELDYGDAPDPFSATQGRYATQHINDGARHVVAGLTDASAAIWLGSSIDADLDGQPTGDADGDNDDGVFFESTIFNRNIFTPIEVTLTNPGFVDAWIDFNADGDWDDPGEQVLDSVLFDAANLTQTFQLTVPSTAPELNGPTTTFARFRSSSSGDLIPSGLAVDGEVEDYKLTIVQGTPPTAVDDSYTVDEDSSFTTTDADGSSTPGFTFDDGVAANDTDPEGGTLSVTQVQGPSHAALFSLESDGTFSYTPEPDFFGVDTFTYRVNDGVLNSNNIATVTIVVNEINDAPTAGNDALTIVEDQELTIDPATLLANDVPGPFESAQTLTITSVSPLSSQSGSVRIVNDQVVYTPRKDFFGTDTFTYVATDNGTSRGISTPLSAVGTVTITILDQNDPPITVIKDFGEIDEDTSLNGTVASLIAGDTPGPADESGQVLTFVGVDPQSTNGGTVTSDGTNFVYTPAADFVGVDTFFYTIRDNGQSNGVDDFRESIGTATVTVTNVNDSPRIQDPLGTITVAEDSPARIVDLQAVFFDPDTISSSDALSFQVVGNDNQTLVTPSITGSQLTLQLLPDQNGQAIILIEAEDLAGETVVDTLTLNVTPVNDAPRLVESIPDFSFDEDSTIPGIVLTPRFFFDPDVSGGDQLTFDVVSNSNPLLVTPTIAGDTLNMELSNNQSGSAVITIRATDSAGLTVSDQFTLLVRPINDVPDTTPDTYEVAQGETLITTDALGIIGDASDDGVLANDSDTEGSALTAVLVRAPANAAFFSLSSNGTFTYQHDGSNQDPDSFTYRADDGTGQSVETTVTINIGEPPAPEHQNPANNLDVNADGFISPIDALLVINFLNANGGGTPVSNLAPPPPFRDVDGNNIITANDALQVINALNNSSSGGGEGEGAMFGSFAVGLLPEGEGVATPEVATEEVVGSTVVNRRYGVRKIEDSELYGPVVPTQPPAQQAAENLYDLTIDLGWVEGDRESDQDPPEDLAIASLLDDLTDL